jgi:hypothetical protein
VVDGLIRAKYARASDVPGAFSGYLMMTREDLFPAIARHWARAVASVAPAPPTSAEARATLLERSIPPANPGPAPMAQAVQIVLRPQGPGGSPWPSLSPSSLEPQPQPQPPNRGARARSAASTPTTTDPPPARPAGGPRIPGGKSEVRPHVAAAPAEKPNPQEPLPHLGPPGQVTTLPGEQQAEGRGRGGQARSHTVTRIQTPGARTAVACWGQSGALRGRRTGAKGGGGKGAATGRSPS